jgi:Spy/CpxP family protein refolding chaperone
MRPGPAAREPEAIEMRKTILTVLGGAVVALVVGAVAGSAQPPPGERGPWMGRPDPMARFLALTEQQQEQVRRAMDEQRSEHEALSEKLERNREQLEQALEAPNPDPAAVGELAIESHRLHEQERALREAREKALRALLTAEQRVKFDALKALREDGMGGPPGPGPRPPRR